MYFVIESKVSCIQFLLLLRKHVMCFVLDLKTHPKYTFLLRLTVVVYKHEHRANPSNRRKSIFWMFRVFFFLLFILLRQTSCRAKHSTISAKKTIFRQMSSMSTAAAKSIDLCGCDGATLYHYRFRLSTQLEEKKQCQKEMERRWSVSFAWHRWKRNAFHFNPIRLNENLMPKTAAARCTHAWLPFGIFISLRFGDSQCAPCRSLIWPIHLRWVNMAGGIN